ALLQHALIPPPLKKTGSLCLSRTLGSCGPAGVFPDQRSNRRGRACLVKGVGAVLGGMTVIRLAVELALVVQPRLGHERLDVALSIGRIARQEPAEGAVSLAHGAPEVLGAGRRDAIFSLSARRQREDC